MPKSKGKRGNRRNGHNGRVRKRVTGSHASERRAPPSRLALLRTPLDVALCPVQPVHIPEALSGFRLLLTTFEYPPDFLLAPSPGAAIYD